MTLDIPNLPTADCVTIEGISASAWTRLESGYQEFVSYTARDAPSRGDLVDLVKSGGIEAMSATVTSSKHLELSRGTVLLTVKAVA